MAGAGLAVGPTSQPGRRSCKRFLSLVSRPPWVLEMPGRHKLGFLSSPPNLSQSHHWWHSFFFFLHIYFFNIYSFGCIGSLLRHTGSLLLHVAPSLPWTDSGVGAGGLVAPWHRGILDPLTGTETSCPALQGGFLTPGPPREVPFNIYFDLQIQAYFREWVTYVIFKVRSEMENVVLNATTTTITTTINRCAHVCVCVCLYIS